MTIDFHPFGEFFASGSLDTNIKIWDIRRKSCIHTYKGHTRGVNVLRFTPDGKWVVSGGEDNSVKVLVFPLVITVLILMYLYRKISKTLIVYDVLILEMLVRIVYKTSRKGYHVFLCVCLVKYI
jgi:WD40 repeat protein